MAGKGRGFEAPLPTLSPQTHTHTTAAPTPKQKKGRELAANGRAALTLWWEALQRSVRVEGAVARLPEEESEEYFRSRPRSSQIGAWVSLQSQACGGRAEIEARWVGVCLVCWLFGWLRCVVFCVRACAHHAHTRRGRCDDGSRRQRRAPFVEGSSLSLSNRPHKPRKKKQKNRQVELEAKYADAATPVPKPPHWGGFLVAPDAVEFWQGRPSRLHDRLKYTRRAGGGGGGGGEGEAAWDLERLYP